METDWRHRERSVSKRVRDVQVQKQREELWK